MEGIDFVWCKGICSVSAYEGPRDISYKFNRYGGLFNPAGEIVQGILLKENGRGIVISMR